MQNTHNGAQLMLVYGFFSEKSPRKREPWEGEGGGDWDIRDRNRQTGDWRIVKDEGRKETKNPEGKEIEGDTKEK